MPSGTVRTAPMSMGEATFAQFTDPQGAQFAVLQSGRGLQRASQEGALVWVELHVRDPQAAIGFYQGLFGWRTQEMQGPGMTYQVLSIAEGDQQEGSFGGVAPLADEREDARWVPYFAVADADATVAAAAAGGGSVVIAGGEHPRRRPRRLARRPGPGPVRRPQARPAPELRPTTPVPHRVHAARRWVACSTLVVRRVAPHAPPCRTKSRTGAVTRRPHGLKTDSTTIARYSSSATAGTITVL